MTQEIKKKILKKLNLVLEDMQMLREGTWVPDEHSCMDTIDNINDAIKFIENENIL